MMTRRILSALVSLAVCTSPGHAADYFVAPDGKDANAGTQAAPFATVARAVSTVSAGDTIHVRAGTYRPAAMLTLGASGREDAPITLTGDPVGAPVILDFADDKNPADRGIQLDGDHWRLVGLTVQHAPDKGVVISGSHNVVDRLVVHRSGNTGVQLSGHDALHPAHNLVLNTDSFENYDAKNRGENADGFTAKFRALGPGNVLRGCRSWRNSDDGFDFWAAASAVRLEDCWAFDNGIDFDHLGAQFAGDGNGFKLGQDSGQHVLLRCIAFDNPANGFDSNRNSAASVDPAHPIEHGVRVLQCTAFRNGRNFAFTEDFAHEIRRCISLASKTKDAFSAKCQTQDNSWNESLPKPTEADFASVDATGAAGPRAADGSLPTLPFLRPSAASPFWQAASKADTRASDQPGALSPHAP